MMLCTVMHVLCGSSLSSSGSCLMILIAGFIGTDVNKAFHIIGDNTLLWL